MTETADTKLAFLDCLLAPGGHGRALTFAPRSELAVELGQVTVSIDHFGRNAVRRHDSLDVLGTNIYRGVHVTSWETVLRAKHSLQLVTL